jgi:Mn2+/Fe2+ NRAMP family transporter
MDTLRSLWVCIGIQIAVVSFTVLVPIRRIQDAIAEAEIEHWLTPGVSQAALLVFCVVILLVGMSATRWRTHKGVIALALPVSLILSSAMIVGLAVTIFNVHRYCPTETIGR